MLYFSYFAENIDCGYKAVLTSTHNLCFRGKIRKRMYTPVNRGFTVKVGCKGVFITRTGYLDVEPL